MWFRDRTPAVPAPTNLYRVRTNGRYGNKVEHDIEAHGWGHQDGWFFFLKDGVEVFTIAAERVESIELMEPEVFFEFQCVDLDAINYGDCCDDEPATRPAPSVTDPGVVGDLSGLPIFTGELPKGMVALMNVEEFDLHSLTG